MFLSRSKRKQNLKKNQGNPDIVLAITLALLLVVGLIVISSATAVLSQNETGNPNYYFFIQLRSVGIGIILFLVGYKIDYHIWKKIAPVLLLVSIIGLILVYIPGIGVMRNGATRWIDIGLQFQPSELAKLSFILYLAVWFENKGNEIRGFMKSTLPFLIILLLVGGLIVLEPDLGTAVILSLIGGAIYFIAGARGTHVVGMILTFMLFVFYLIKSAPYRMQRFMVFLNPEADSSGQGYQINQALLAVGSGGILGLGFGKSRQKFNYLPESSTDSIYAIIAEETGMIGSVLVITLFVVFAARGFKIARESPDIFARLVAVGITMWIAGQAFINILAILSLMPLTGVPLPFISYGGSSIIMLLLACGILLNISRYTKKGEENAHSRFGRWNWRSYFTGSGRN